MNRPLSLALVAVALTLSLSACRKKTVGENIDDALNNRPAEGLQDKAEDVEKDVKQGIKDLEKR